MLRLTIDNFESSNMDRIMKKNFINTKIEEKKLTNVSFNEISRLVGEGYNLLLSKTICHNKGTADETWSCILGKQKSNIIFK